MVPESRIIDDLPNVFLILPSPESLSVLRSTPTQPIAIVGYFKAQRRIKMSMFQAASHIKVTGGIFTANSGKTGMSDFLPASPVRKVDTHYSPSSPHPPQVCKCWRARSSVVPDTMMRDKRKRPGAIRRLAGPS